MSQQYLEVELDGKPRLLRFDFNSICEIEERFGKGIARIFSEEQVGFNVIRLFYWAGLKWKDRGLTVDRVGQMLHTDVAAGRSLDELLKPIMQALKLSKVLGNTKEDEDDEGNGTSEQTE
jgi:hypothetical protein